MQAQPQSNSAARNYATASSSRSASSSIAPSSPSLTRDGQTATPAILAEPSASPSASLASSAGRRPSPHELSSSLSEGAGLAHDAGNLLQALGLYSELLQAPGVLRPEHKHYASELRQLSERSNAMIQRLLKGFTASPAKPPTACSPMEIPRPSVAWSEPQVWMESPRRPTPSCLNPAETLHQQAALLQRIASPWAVISVMTQDGLPGLEFDAEILERIAVNLVLNAAEALRNAGGEPDPRRLRRVPPAGADAERNASVEAAPEFGGDPGPGRIRVSLRMADGRLRLSVEDNGPGMPPSIAAAFLRPAPLPPGTARGLGHRIVHELAGATGGQLSIRVRPGTGTSFSVDWPVKQASQTDYDGPTLRLVSSHRAFADLAARGARSRAVNGGLDAC